MVALGCLTLSTFFLATLLQTTCIYDEVYLLILSSNSPHMNALTIGDDKALTTVQVAQRWNCHHETVRRRQREGLLASIKLGRHRRYLLSAVWEAEKKMAAMGAVRKT